MTMMSTDPMQVASRFTAPLSYQICFEAAHFRSVVQRRAGQRSDVHPSATVRRAAVAMAVTADRKASILSRKEEVD